METIKVSKDLFERLTTAAEVLANGSRLSEKQREAWAKIAEQAKEIHYVDVLDLLKEEYA